MRRNLASCVAITLFGVLLAVALLAGAVTSQRRSAAELEAAGRAHARSLETDASMVPAAEPITAVTSARQVPARIAAAPASRPAESDGFPWTPAILNRPLFPNGLLANARPAHAAAIDTTPEVSARQRSDSTPAIPTDSSFLQAKGLWKETGHSGWGVPGAPAGAKGSASGKPVNDSGRPPPPVSRRTPSLHESRRDMHPARLR